MLREKRILMLPDRINFHDSGIISISRYGDDIFLELESVTIGTEKENADDGFPEIDKWWIVRDGVLKLEGVSAVYINEGAIDLKMEKESGEIVDLEFDGESCVSMLVFWKNFEDREDIVRNYKIICNNIYWIQEKSSADYRE